MKVLGFSQDFTSCDRCGKTELKGTWAIETSEGEIFRLGSSCIHKKFQMEPSAAKALIDGFKKEEKSKALFAQYIQPLKHQLAEHLKGSFTTTYENLPVHGIATYHRIEQDYQRIIEFRLKKYKITSMARQACVLTSPTTL